MSKPNLEASKIFVGKIKLLIVVLQFEYIYLFALVYIAFMTSGLSAVIKVINTDLSILCRFKHKSRYLVRDDRIIIDNNNNVPNKHTN